MNPTKVTPRPRHHPLFLTRYHQNTCVDPPHDRAVTSLSFQPVLHDLSSSSGSDTDTVPLAVTTSLDNRFKVWLLVDGEGQGEGEGGDGGRRKRRRRVASWACRSVSSYRGLPCLGADFSEDGSLLAVNCSKVCVSPTYLGGVVLNSAQIQNVTVWDPYSCQLRQTFSTPHRDETFK